MSFLVDCNVEKKIFYGKSSISKTNCEEHGGCFQNGMGCFFSNENVSGFRLVVGICIGCNPHIIFDRIDRIECSRECLKSSLCNCFIYETSTNKCKIFTNFCFTINYNTKIELIYNKYASNKLICGYGDCLGNIIVNAQVNWNDCFEICSNHTNCKAIVSAVAKGFNGKYVCLPKHTICDFTLSSHAHNFVVMCLRGPAFPDWATNHFLNNREIIDNSNETCKLIFPDENFNLKIPWPSVGNFESDFKIMIIGKKLGKCLESNGLNHPNGVITYVVDSFQKLPLFHGIFKACRLTNGDNNTFCIYLCTCGEDYCEAVHIRAFSINNINMAICNYQIM